LPRFFSLLLLCAGLAGCGFHLRGDTPMAFKSVYISSNAPSAVANEIRRSLANGPTRLATTAREGEGELRILSEARERSILSLSTSGTVLEFQLRLRISYQLTDGGEEPLIAPTELLLNRTVAFSDTAVIAKGIEEGLQYQDMERAAAQLILNRLAFIRRPAAKAG
jgi:LPS-assembly lipoprotein